MPILAGPTTRPIRFTVNVLSLGSHPYTPQRDAPQVQGVLSSAAEAWPHIHISDSLVMADTAVRMAEAGCR